ncbi:MAG TPA: ribonuclease H-like domain-containing protein [Candidatus Eisenbacteria bacterium]|nr:ribonuclease H-like domain-containing protein [Candidatus Eisenbacteria bacterium]
MTTALDGLRARLGELARARRMRMAVDVPPPAANGHHAALATASCAAPVIVPDPRCESIGIEALLPGGELSLPQGRVWVHERLRSELDRHARAPGELSAPPGRERALAALVHDGLASALFLDLETGGLASSPVFLAGVMFWNGEEFVLRQYFARHYGEEAALIAAVSSEARRFSHLVTFNGRSYDAPFLRGRSLVHGVPLSLPERHVDLLHAARRRWKRVLPNCRLQTLEQRICRRHRSGDVPGAAIPELYHAWVRDGDPWPLAPVFHHNLLDVLTMGELLESLCAPWREPEPA